MMKIIFLDIDGVLNSARTATAYRGYGFFPLGLSTSMQDCSQQYRREEILKHAKLDPIAFKLIEYLIKKSDAKVVISSSWRIGSTLEDFIDLFGAYGIKGEVIGLTPVINTQNRIRGDEIQMWLDQNGQEVSHYVILDDDSDMLKHQLGEFVKVDREIGFSVKDLHTALTILGVNV